MFELDPDEVDDITRFVSGIGAEEADAVTPDNTWKRWIPHFFVGIAALAILASIIAVIFAIIKY